MPSPTYHLPENSESLLTEILGLLVTLNSNVETFRVKLEKIENDFSDVVNKIESIIKDGFPDGDLIKHKKWHLKNFLTRLFN